MTSPPDVSEQRIRKLDLSSALGLEFFCMYVDICTDTHVWAYAYV